jgi:hypothetical protein
MSIFEDAPNEASNDEGDLDQPMEPLEKRLARFLNGSPNEYTLSVLNSIGHGFLPEIRAARDGQMVLTIFLGTHAIIQTIAEKIFGLSSLDGTRFYLEHFVDRDVDDRRYSLIAEEIHSMRNTVAHVWFSSRAHRRAFDASMPQGWRRDDKLLRINPILYVEDFLDGFAAKGPIWRIPRMRAKELATVQKYRFIADWLELPKGDAVRSLIAALSKAGTDESRAEIEANISARFKKRFLPGDSL